jgi:catechol 2,3-dioxygenase-like lactoylglutathione lyase family enzyme
LTAAAADAMLPGNRPKGGRMLNRARIAAVIPVSDLDKSIEFFSQKLGLGTAERDEIPGNPGARFSVGGGELYIYKSVGAGQSRHTVAMFEVDDIEQTVETLRNQGVTFEEYDMPNMKTVKGIATFGEDKGAFFKDPDGNIIGIGQPARVRAAV